ncbi:MAG: aspartate aminotransferase, partial [Bacteroidota bacterium]
MLYKRMPIEKESPEETGYDNILFNLAESSVTDLKFDELNLFLDHLKLEYIAHRGHSGLRKLIAADANLDEVHVLLTNGAAGALFIINSSLLST